MEQLYQPEIVEREAQQYWDEHRCFEVTEDTSKEKFYCLSMLPYPSGRLHMGHVRNYTIGDVISRFQRMQGKNVLQPMGWDAFGLPAENAAIKHNVHPAKWTYANIEEMRSQLKRMGYAYDWSREVTTCKPEYYRWEQWLFTRLMRKGLAYRANGIVNWDPVDQTVLANEQVIDGKGWRSGAPIERREMPQWFLKITEYADELLDWLDKLDDWPESVKTMQRNWIGRSEGIDIEFPVAGHDALRVFTTRPDTLFGVTCMAVAPEHPLAAGVARNNPGIAAFIDECRKVQASEAALETLEKKGMPIGVNAQHPLTGEDIPIWVANFVVMSYGTGAVMAVPGHDERDWEFATKYGLPIVQVIEPLDDATVDLSQDAFVAYGRLINSGEYDGMSYEEAFDALAAYFEAQGTGQRRVNYRLRDWLVSRQRFWGCPVPAIYDNDGEPEPVPDDQLPVVLPENVEVTGGASPLTDAPEFQNATDPDTGAPVRRESDTFDTFMESSWYYARYTSPGADAMLDERARYWLPVDQYVGGIEHAILHLIYARFYYKLLRDEGLVDSDEPFTRLLCQGMVIGETYYREDDKGHKTYYNPADVELERDAGGRIVGARLISDGQPVTPGPIEKMSKSKNNGIDPEALLSRYGADTVRLFVVSDVPPDQALEWSEEGVEGMFRFLKRLWRLVRECVERGEPAELDLSALTPQQKALRRTTHKTIAKVTDDITRRYAYNTAIAAVRELLNAVAKFNDDSALGRAVVREALRSSVLMLTPVVPHVCHSLWYALGGDNAVVDESWPVFDADAIESDSVEIVVQVNGKLRSRIQVAADADRDAMEEAALGDENVKRFIEGAAIRKVIVVPGKLVNLVV